MSGGFAVPPVVGQVNNVSGNAANIVVNNNNNPPICLHVMANSVRPESSLRNGNSPGPSTPKGLLNANSQSFSEIPMQKFSHLWTIKHFNLIPVEMERLCSPWFSPPNSKDLWFLKLRLKAFDENNGNAEFIGVHLFLKESGDKKREVRAHYTISVLDSMGNKRFTGECSKPEGRIFKAGTEGHGYKLLCPREGIFRPENKLLGEDNSLNIRCEVTVFGEIKHIPPRPEPSTPYTDAERTKSSLSADLAKFFHADRDKDIILIAKGGVRIGAHKAILMARSDVFMAMFDHDMVEKKSNEVNLEDMEPEIVKAMVHFMYTDEIYNLEQATDLLLAADRFQLPRLRILCEEHLLQKISVDTVGNLLTIADMTNADALKKECLEFTARHSFDVSASPEFSKSVGKRPYLFKEAFDVLAKRYKKQ